MINFRPIKPYAPSRWIDNNRVMWTRALSNGSSFNFLCIVDECASALDLHFHECLRDDEILCLDVALCPRRWHQDLLDSPAAASVKL